MDAYSLHEYNGDDINCWVSEFHCWYNMSNHSFMLINMVYNKHSLTS